MTKKLTVSEYLRLAALLSDTDRKIVSRLQANGREPFSQIAREVGVTEKTVRRRVRELIDDGVIRITAVTDPDVLGYGAAALLQLDVDPKVPTACIVDSLKAISAVDYIIVTTGRFAICAELLCRNRTSMHKIVEEQVGRIEGIRSIEILPYLSLHYQNAHFAAARHKEDSESGVRPREVDNTDRKIIRALSKDGRASFQQIADELHVSEAQVRVRLRQLIDSNTVNVIALINPMSLDYRTMALIGVKVAPKHRVIDLADALARLPNVTYVAICAGRYDIWAEFICESEYELMKLVDRDIRRWPSVGDVEISLYLSLHYKWLTPIRDDLA